MKKTLRHPEDVRTAFPHPVSEQVQIPQSAKERPIWPTPLPRFRSPDVAIAIGMFLLQNSLTQISAWFE